MKKIRKSLLLCVAALSMSGLAGCENPFKRFTPNSEPENGEQQSDTPKEVNVESLTIDPTSMNLTIGDSRTITATVLPENATNKTVIFKSSNTGAATVSDAGVVTAVAEGVAVISCTSAADASKHQICVVQVEKPASQVVLVEEVVIGESSLTIALDSDWVQLTASVLPENATDKSLSWSVSNSNVLDLDEANGRIKPKALGSSSVTVRSVSNPAAFKVFTITVEAVVVAVSSVSVEESISIEENATAYQLSATVLPAEATNKAVNWSSSDDSIASVSATGLVTPHHVGQTDITVKSVADPSKFGICHVTVYKVELLSFSLDTNSLVFKTTDTGSNAQHQLVPTFNPAEPTYKEINWSSNDSNVATVSDTGLVQMVGAGTAVITALHVNSLKTQTCLVTVTQPETLNVGFPIEESKSFQEYKKHTAKNNENPFGEFVDRNEPYEVGDDNNFSFRPDFEVRDSAQANNPIVDNASWSYPFTITVEKKVNDSYQPAPSGDYDIISNISCDLRFSTIAVGSFYKVTVVIGGFDSEAIEMIGLENMTATYEFKVVDGYNVTNELELAYLDTTTPETMYLSRMGDGEDTFYADMLSFKAAHGLNQTYSPTTLVLHKDLFVSPSCLPEEFFYTAAYADAQGWPAEEKAKCVGSLKDYSYLYCKWSTGKTTLSGNYFTLNWSEVPLMKRSWGELSTANKVDSHSTFMRLYSGEYEIKNINFIGNASVAENEDQTARAGGLIGFKSTWANSILDVNNTLGHACYITIMAESAWSTLGDGRVAEVSVRKSKLYDNYNCFFYNWGGHLTVEDSTIEGAGGPVVIQDHWDSTWENDNVHKFETLVYDPINDPVHYTYETYGYIPVTTFVDSTINNYVEGTEAWFESFNAGSQVEQIKQFGDLLPATYPLHSMIFDANHNPSVFAQLSANSQHSFFNFVVLNKSAHAQGITTDQVDGQVKFFHRNGNDLDLVDDFHYLAPAENDGSEAIDASLVPEVLRFYKFRKVGKMGAPIMETAGGVGFYNPGAGDIMLDLDSQDIENDPQQIGPDFVTNASENCAIYFSGMMLVCKLGTFGA